MNLLDFVGSPEIWNHPKLEPINANKVKNKKCEGNNCRWQKSYLWLKVLHLWIFHRLWNGGAFVTNVNFEFQLKNNYQVPQQSKIKRLTQWVLPHNELQSRGLRKFDQQMWHFFPLIEKCNEPRGKKRLDFYFLIHKFISLISNGLKRFFDLRYVRKNKKTYKGCNNHEKRKRDWQSKNNIFCEPKLG